MERFPVLRECVLTRISGSTDCRSGWNSLSSGTSEHPTVGAGKLHILSENANRDALMLYRGERFLTSFEDLYFDDYG